MIIAIAIAFVIAHCFALEWLGRIARETGYLRGQSDAADAAKRWGQNQIALGILNLPLSNAHKSIEQRKKERAALEAQQ